MPTTSNLSDVSPKKQSWWDIVGVLGEYTTPLYLKQIENGKNDTDPNSFAALSASYWESEVARASEASVPPGITLSVPLASKGPRQVTALKSSEPLTQQSFDWLDRDYDHYNIELNAPEGIVAKFDVWQHGFVSISVEQNTFPRDVDNEAGWLDKIEEVLNRSPSPALPILEFRVVMGHGNDQQWRILRDELREHHGFDVSAFEGRPRAGQTINAVLEDMAGEASVALIVLSLADEMADGSWRARQNVVHEVGFFQGRLGWTNAIAVVEDGVELFSNLDGTQQIRFPKGNISAAVGNVSATLSAKKRQRAEPGRG